MIQPGFRHYRIYIIKSLYGPGFPITNAMASTVCTNSGTRPQNNANEFQYLDMQAMLQIQAREGGHQRTGYKQAS
jgi:hypothetical protein